MPISEQQRLKAVEDKLNQAQQLITQAFSIMQYINSAPCQDSSNATGSNGMYPGQYTEPKPLGEGACTD